MRSTWFANAVALGRVVIGTIFLWAGLEKVIGAGGAWTSKGFLAYGTSGTLGWPFVTGEVAEGTVFNPTHELWVSLAANEGAISVIDFMVQFGESPLVRRSSLGLPRGSPQRRAH